MAEPLVLAERHGGALVLRLNRPEAGNAISREVALALGDHLRNCEADKALRALVITGSGPRYFCTGGDVKAYAKLAGAEELDRVFNLMRDVCDAIEAATDCRDRGKYNFSNHRPNNGAGLRQIQLPY
jgi:enoyl-CoA hydratase/carnithine racemase